MNKSAHNLQKEITAGGKFLALAKVEFVDERGRTRLWEAAERLNTPGAVMIIGHLMPSNRLLLTRQFRPPVGRYVIEFPAGLIEPGEPAEETARRELREETGYAGLLSFCSDPVYSSSGMSGESTCIAIVEINDYEFQDGPPRSFQEDGENIEVFTVAIPELRNFLRSRGEDGDGVDSKVMMFMMAQEFFHA